MPNFPNRRDRPSCRSALRLGLAGAALIGLLMIALPASPQSPSAAPNPVAPSLETVLPLRVATRMIKPDVFEENGQLVGFSADIGRRILDQLQRNAEIKTYPGVPEILNAIRLEQADLGIAAIALTRQREQDFDFSHPILSGGLQIMVRVQDEPSIVQQLFATLFSTKILQLLGITTLLMLIPVHIVWYFERHNQELISTASYVPGIFEALWWTVLTLVGQADEMPKGPVGRIVALFWVFAGIIFVTYFTAIITAELTVQELQGNIQELSDLQNRQVALIGDSEALNYLHEQNIELVMTFPQPEPAYAALLAADVDAIVASRPLLLYYAAHEFEGQVRIVGTPFREQFYSIAMPKDSPYRKPINQAILTLKENGTYGEIYQQWFGMQPQD